MHQSVTSSVEAFGAPFGPFFPDSMRTPYSTSPDPASGKRLSSVRLAEVTYSGYAHQGSNRLIVAVVLAAAMVAVFFHRDSLQASHKGARGLAHLLGVQNIIVLAGAAIGESVTFDEPPSSQQT